MADTAKDNSAKELSSLQCMKCGKCGATFYPNEDGTMHFRWSTGAPGKLSDLASLVCQPYGNDECLNPSRYTVDPNADSWQKRREFIDRQNIEGWSKE